MGCVCNNNNNNNNNNNMMTCRRCFLPPSPHPRLSPPPPLHSAGAGPIDCAVKTIRHEGFLALYKSWFTVYMRLGPWQMVFYLTFEQVNRAMGIKAI